jgi:hypothetical protein
MAFSHPSTSNSDTLSVRSYGSSSRGPTRLIVVLPDDTLTESYEIGVPVPESMTISELQREALRRARALGLTIHKGDFNLRLDSRNGPIAFPDDLVVIKTPGKGGLYPLDHPCSCFGLSHPIVYSSRPQSD